MIIRHLLAFADLHNLQTLDHSVIHDIFADALVFVDEGYISLV